MFWKQRKQLQELQEHIKSLERRIFEVEKYAGGLSRHVDTLISRIQTFIHNQQKKDKE